MAYRCPRCGGQVEVRNYRRYQRRGYFVGRGSCGGGGGGGGGPALLGGPCRSTSYAARTEGGGECLRCSGGHAHTPTLNRMLRMGRFFAPAIYSILWPRSFCIAMRVRSAGIVEIIAPAAPNHSNETSWNKKMEHQFERLRARIWIA